MKTDVYKFDKKNIDHSAVNDLAVKTAQYNGLDKKQELKLTLLCEELIEMLPNLLIYGNGKMWIENDDGVYQIHAVVEANKTLSSIDREDILKVSTTGKNAAAVGIVNKIRIAAEVMFSNYADTAGTAGSMLAESHYAYYNMGVYQDPTVDYQLWSLAAYKNSTRNGTEEWDELERSIIANLADDVTVGIIGGKVEITVKKKF